MDVNENPFGAKQRRAVPSARGSGLFMQSVLRCSPLSPPQNLKRVAEVWMDEYAEFIYQRRPEYRHLSAGDVAAQKELRNNLNCKSFKWFMNEVAWDLPKFYPPVEPPAAAWGEASLCSKICSGQMGCGLVLKLALSVGSSFGLLWVGWQVGVTGPAQSASKSRAPLPLHGKKKAVGQLFL